MNEPADNPLEDVTDEDRDKLFARLAPLILDTIAAYPDEKDRAYLADKMHDTTGQGMHVDLATRTDTGEVRLRVLVRESGHEAPIVNVRAVDLGVHWVDGHILVLDTDQP